MKQKTTQTRSRWLLVCLLSLLMTLTGARTAWGATLTENFNGGLPAGWSIVGDVQNFDETRARGGSGYSKGSSTKSDNQNYIITEAVEGSLTFYARAYNKNTAAYVFVYEYNGLAIGTQLYSTGNMYSSSPSFTSYTANLGDYKGQVAIALNYACIDDLTYTQMEAIEGPALTVKDGSTKITTGYNYNFGLAVAGTEKTFTLTNPGTAAVNGLTVAETGDYSAVLSATTIAAGGEATLTITMPSTTGSSEITISSTTEGIADFVINASGTVRNPNKVYLDFSDGLIPDGWTSVKTGSYGSAWAASTGYISQSGGYSSYAWAFTSPKLNFENGEEIFFETAKYGDSGYSSPSITVEYTTDATGATGWTAIGSAFTDDTYGNWTSRSVTIPVEGVKRIRFNGWYIHMRNIYGGEEPLNPAPKSLTASNLTSSSAQLSWTSTASNFNIQYKATGDAVWTTIENTTDNPYTLTGLTAETGYQVKVQADHGVNGLSDYTDPISFTTTYGVPFSQDFNVSSIPSGWAQYSGLMDNVIAGTADLSDGSGWNFSTSNGVFGQKHAYTNVYGSSCYRWLVSPSITLDANQQIIFDLALTAYSGTKVAAGTNGTDDKFAVLISTDGGSSWTKLAQWDNAGGVNRVYNDIATEGETVRLSLSAYNGQTAKFAFYVESTASNADNNLHIANVEINEAASYSMAISGGDVSESTIAFGTVKNTTTTKTFTINNEGSNDLTSVSVVSSDNTVFTVSETGFDIAAGESKDITVTFVKAVDGDYSKTITISQANVATPIELTVTATYQTPTPATMDATLDEAAIGASVDFGTVNKATVKTFKVTNTGEATLNATITITGTDAAKFTPSTTSLVVAGGSNETFTITFNSDDEDVAKTATVTLSAADLSDISFDVTGTYSNFWTEDFEGGALPDYWATTGWTITTSAYSGNGTYMAYAGTSSSTLTLTTPRLQASAGDELTFFVGGGTDGSDKLTIEYSNDMNSWTPIDGSPFTSGGTKTFTAPADGYYYLKFNGRYASLDNFEGFKLAIPAHIMAITASTIPTSGLKEGQAFNATVDVKENRGVAETGVIAKLYMNSVVIGTSTATDFEANESKQITIPCTPTTGADDASMYIEVVYASGSETVSTTPVVRNVAALTNLTLDETSDDELVSGTYDNVILKRKFTEGWNTVCLPFTISDVEAFFGAGAKAYNLTSYSDGDLGFEKADELEATYPYVVYVPAAITEDIIINNINITINYGNKTADSRHIGDAYFRGTYVPIAAGGWTKNADDDKLYGVTSAGKIAKIGDTATSKGFRGYFDLPADATARLSFYDETTGITTVMDAKELNNDGKVYNLNGQRVENAQKGLYIVNGRKVVVK